MEYLRVDPKNVAIFSHIFSVLSNENPINPSNLPNPRQMLGEALNLELIA
jgi:hypothetical protein